MSAAAEPAPLRHLAVVNIAAWSHVRAVICFTAALLLRDSRLYVTFFVPKGEQTRSAALWARYGLSEDATERLRLVYTSATQADNADPDPLKQLSKPKGEGGAVVDFILQYYNQLVSGQAIGDHAALPCPSAILADNFCAGILSYALDHGYRGDTQLWISTDATPLTYFDACSRQALFSRESTLWTPIGIPPRWTHEYQSVTLKVARPIGVMPVNMIEMYTGRMRGHRQIVGFSRQLLPQGVADLEADARLRKAKQPLVVGAAYLPDFWSNAPRSFPGDDVLFDWLARQSKRSVILVTFGSSFFPGLANSWQLETLVDALIRHHWRFVLLLGSEGVEHMDRAILERVKQKAEASGNLHHGWCDQELCLRHPSIAFCLSHGGAGTMLESLIAGGVSLIVWPFSGDQPINASSLAVLLDCAFELWEVRDRLAGGFRIASKPGLCVRGTPEALAEELDYVLAAAKGEEGRRKRANALKAQALLREEQRLHAGDYLDEFLKLL